MPLLDQGFLTRKQDDQGSFSARVGLVALKGSFTVASSTKLINMLGMDIQEHEVVILDFSDTVFMDDSAALVVEQMLDIAATEEVGVIVLGLKGSPATTLQGLNVLRSVPKDQFVTTLEDAKETAQRLLET